MSQPTLFTQFIVTQNPIKYAAAQFTGNVPNWTLGNAPGVIALNEVHGAVNVVNKQFVTPGQYYVAGWTTDDPDAPPSFDSLFGLSADQQGQLLIISDDAIHANTAYCTMNGSAPVNPTGVLDIYISNTEANDVFVAYGVNLNCNQMTRSNTMGAVILLNTAQTVTWQRIQANPGDSLCLAFWKNGAQPNSPPDYVVKSEQIMAGTNGAIFTWNGTSADNNTVLYACSMNDENWARILPGNNWSPADSDDEDDRQSVFKPGCQKSVTSCYKGDEDFGGIWAAIIIVIIILIIIGIIGALFWGGDCSRNKNFSNESFW